jgi:AraC-like DNA-binding protein
MNISEYKPDNRLNEIIYSYYFINNKNVAHENIPPLGHPVIQFHLKNNIETFFKNYDFPRDEVMIVGQLTKFARIEQSENTRLIGVNLKPTTLYKFTKTNCKIFTDIGIPAAEYFDNRIYELLDSLKTNITDKEKVELLNKYFIEIISEKNLLHDNFDTLIDTIIEKRGKITIAEMQKIFPVTNRTLQRYFNERLGISLKTFFRIIRNLNLFRSLNNNEKKLSELIFELGYHDYSHFIKDFKLMTGMTPVKYFSNKEVTSRLLIK